MKCSTCESYMDDNSLICDNCKTPYINNVAKSTANTLTAPITIKRYLLMFIIEYLSSYVILLFWAFSKRENINRKNYARARLIWVFAIILIFITMYFVKETYF